MNEVANERACIEDHSHDHFMIESFFLDKGEGIGYLNDVNAWTERCTTTDADSDQIILVFRDGNTARCYPHPPVQKESG